MVNSFSASAIGCGSPIILTLFGPLRNCAYPRIFRSSKVKKAIAANTMAKLIIDEERNDIIWLRSVKRSFVSFVEES